jgi:hypothetical protein
MAVTAGSSECFNPEQQQEYGSHSHSVQITLNKVAISGTYSSVRFEYLLLWISTAVTMASDMNNEL